jgi:glutathione S-transferase
LKLYGGPYLFGTQPTLADAMYAPVVTRFVTYGVTLDSVCASYSSTILALPYMQEWIEAASKEIDDIEDFEAEF